MGWLPAGMSHEDHSAEMTDAFEKRDRLSRTSDRASLSKELAVEVANIVDFHGKVDLMVIGEMRKSRVAAGLCVH